MIATSDRRRIGWMGWTLITLALVAAALFGAWRYAMATNAVALLNAGPWGFISAQPPVITMPPSRLHATGWQRMTSF